MPTIVLPQLQFEGGPVAGERNGWTGEWPPPARMGVAVGKQTKLPVYFEEKTLEEQEIALDELARVAEITWYKLESASALTDEQAADMTHVVRGARYVLE